MSNSTFINEKYYKYVFHLKYSRKKLPDMAFDGNMRRRFRYRHLI